MLESILDRYLGRWAKARKVIDSLAITSLTTSAYASGKVVVAGGAPLIGQCVSISVGAPVDVVQVNLWETAATGSCLKPKLRVHFFRAAYATPAQLANFEVSPIATDKLGYVDIDTADWTENTTTSSIKIAEAHVRLTTPLRIRPASDSRTIYMVIEARDTFTFAASARIDANVDVDA